MSMQISGPTLGIGAFAAFLAGSLTVWGAGQTFGKAQHHGSYDVCMFDTMPEEQWRPLATVMGKHSTVDGGLYLPTYSSLFGFDLKCRFHPDLIVEYLDEHGYATVDGLKRAYAEAVKTDHAALKAAIQRITVVE